MKVPRIQVPLVLVLLDLSLHHQVVQGYHRPLALQHRSGLLVVVVLVEEVVEMQVITQTNQAM